MRQPISSNPQLTAMSCVALLMTPQGEKWGLRSVEYEHRGHTDIIGDHLRVSRGDLKQLWDAVLGPAYFTISSTIRYLQADLDQSCAAHPNGIEIPKRRDLGAGR